MKWRDVDGIREYLGGNITRKAVYNWVADGLKVARLGESGRRYMFSEEWTDEYLTARAERKHKRDAGGGDNREGAADGAGASPAAAE